MKRFLAAVASLGLAACAVNPAMKYGTAPGTTLLQSQELPAPGASDLNAPQREYHIGPFDKLVIDVFGIEGLDKREVQADAGGRISLPLAGTVDANGLTPAQLAAVLTTKLRQAYVRDPQVAVNLKDPVSQVVTVGGEVREPGLYPVLGNMTLMRAVAKAKGLSDTASRNNVVILRAVSGKKYVALYNLKAIERGAYPDPSIYPNDVIMVGESSSRRFFTFASAGAAALSPLILLLQATK